MPFTARNSTPFDVTLDAVTPVCLSHQGGTFPKGQKALMVGIPKDTFLGKIYFELRQADKADVLNNNKPTAVTVKLNGPYEGSNPVMFNIDEDTALWAVLDAGTCSVHCTPFAQGRGGN